MKKIIKVLLVVAFVALIGACSSSDVKGKYVLSSYTQNNITVSKGTKLWKRVFANVDVEKNYYVELKDNNKVKVVLKGSINATGTYKISDSKITITINKKKVSGPIKKNKLIYTYDNDKYVFEK